METTSKSTTRTKRSRWNSNYRMWSTRDTSKQTHWTDSTSNLALTLSAKKWRGSKLSCTWITLISTIRVNIRVKILLSINRNRIQTTRTRIRILIKESIQVKIINSNTNIRVNLLVNLQVKTITSTMMQLLIHSTTCLLTWRLTTRI